MKSIGTGRDTLPFSGMGRGAMRFLLVAALAAGVAGWLVPGRASAISSSELLKSCRAVTKTAGAGDGASLELPEVGLACWYYMSALQNMSVLVDQNGEHVLGVCAPAQSTVLDFVRIFVRAARKSPAEDGNAAALLVPELAKAYPCGGQEADQPR